MRTAHDQTISSATGPIRDRLDGRPCVEPAKNKSGNHRRIARDRSWRRSKRGASAVEFALIVPILLAFVTGILDVGWLFFIEGAMADVARTVARDVSVGVTTTADAATEVQTRLANYGYTFAVSATEASNDVTVSISVPMADVALIDLFGMFGGGDDISTAVTMRKEP